MFLSTGPQGLRPVATGFEHYWFQMLLVYTYWSQSYWFCPTSPRTTGLLLLAPVATGFIWKLSNKPVELEPDRTRRNIFPLSKFTPEKCAGEPAVLHLKYNQLQSNPPIAISKCHQVITVYKNECDHIKFCNKQQCNNWVGK